MVLCDKSEAIRFHGALCIALCIAPEQGQGLGAPFETFHIGLSSTRVTEWVGL